jgi:Fe2+ or Zn2+ uptake regulation protein
MFESGNQEIRRAVLEVICESSDNPIMNQYPKTDIADRVIQQLDDVSEDDVYDEIRRLEEQKYLRRNEEMTQLTRDGLDLSIQYGIEVDLWHKLLNWWRF